MSFRKIYPVITAIPGFSIVMFIDVDIGDHVEFEKYIKSRYETRHEIRHKIMRVHGLRGDGKFDQITVLCKEIKKVTKSKHLRFVE